MSDTKDFIGFLQGWMSKEVATCSQNIRQDTRILEMGLLDSLQIMELIAAVEQTYDVSIPLEELVEENFQTPDAIRKMLERHAGEAP